MYIQRERERERERERYDLYYTIAANIAINSHLPPVGGSIGPAVRSCPRPRRYYSY